MKRAKTDKTIVRLPKEQRVNAIMEAARSVFTQTGYEAASISEIASHAGVAEGTIYKFFENKRELVTKVVERWYEQMMRGYEEGLRGITGTRNRLRYMVWRHLKSMEGEKGLTKLVLSEIRVADNYKDSEIFRLNRKYTRQVLAIVTKGIENGEIRPGFSLEILRAMIFGGVEHYAWKYLYDDGDLDPESAADSIIDIVFRGIGKAPDTASKEVARLLTIADRFEALLHLSDGDRQNEKQIINPATKQTR